MIENKGRLYGATSYLIGCMDRVADGGIGWRKSLEPFLRSLGIVILNPCDKPIDVGHETIEDRNRRRKLKQLGEYHTLAKEIKELRSVDLAMVDMSRFIICNIDVTIHAVGTYEELFWANRCKKPVLIHCEQSVKELPDWLFGVLPYEFFFDNWEALKTYISLVNNKAVDKERLNYRWKFFNYSRLTPEGQEEYYNAIC